MEKNELIKFLYEENYQKLVQEIISIILREMDIYEKLDKKSWKRINEIKVECIKWETPNEEELKKLKEINSVSEKIKLLEKYLKNDKLLESFARKNLEDIKKDLEKRLKYKKYIPIFNYYLRKKIEKILKTEENKIIKDLKEGNSVELLNSFIELLNKISLIPYIPAYFSAKENKIVVIKDTENKYIILRRIVSECGHAIANNVYNKELSPVINESYDWAARLIIEKFLGINFYSKIEELLWAMNSSFGYKYVNIKKKMRENSEKYSNLTKEIQVILSTTFDMYSNVTTFEFTPKVEIAEKILYNIIEMIFQDALLYTIKVGTPAHQIGAMIIGELKKSFGENWSKVMGYALYDKRVNKLNPGKFIQDIEIYYSHLKKKE